MVFRLSLFFSYIATTFVIVDCLVCNQIRIPVSSGFTSDSIEDQWHHLIDSFEYFEAENKPPTQCISGSTIGATNRNKYAVPLLGAKIYIDVNTREYSNNQEFSEFLLSIETTNKDDMIFLSTKLLSILKGFNGIASLYPLRKLVATFYNELPPFTGIDVSLQANFDAIDNIFSNRGKEFMYKLKHDGFVVVKSPIKTSPYERSNLSKLLVEKTGQDKAVRSDTVAFITNSEAKKYSVGTQYDLLMAITSYLNEHLEFENSMYQPLPPGTRRRPLSNPKDIQIASYLKGEFYREHSDNSLVKGANENQRKNYRCYTCILYCNENWDYIQDGGALRLYKDSVSIVNPKDAIEKCEYVDINPDNGELLIFDSRLIHSVQKVTSSHKERLAFTLWTLRPEDNGCVGEIYDAGEKFQFTN